jgi:hypothetical protein
MVGLARAVDHRLLREGRYSQLQYITTVVAGRLPSDGLNTSMVSKK